MPLSQEAMDRFWSKVDIRSPDECWPWTAGKSPEGHGRFKADGVDLRASRIVCELTHGPIPDGLFVLHSCDNPPCCNPAHLSPGTPRRNQVEAVERGRRPQGLAPQGQADAGPGRRDPGVAPARRGPGPAVRRGEEHGDLAAPGTVGGPGRAPADAAGRGPGRHLRPPPPKARPRPGNDEGATWAPRGKPCQFK